MGGGAKVRPFPLTLLVVLTTVLHYLNVSKNLLRPTLLPWQRKIANFNTKLAITRIT